MSRHANAARIERPASPYSHQMRQRLCQQALTSPKLRKLHVLNFLDHVRPIHGLVQTLPRSQPPQQIRLPFPPASASRSHIPPGIRPS